MLTKLKNLFKTKQQPTMIKHVPQPPSSSTTAFTPLPYTKTQRVVSQATPYINHRSSLQSNHDPQRTHSSDQHSDANNALMTYLVVDALTSGHSTSYNTCSGVSSSDSSNSSCSSSSDSSSSSWD